MPNKVKFSRAPFTWHWWKQLERLGLILGVTGISITSLLAGISRVQEEMQAVGAFREKIDEQARRVERLEEINHQQDNEIQYLKGRIESHTTPPALPAEQRSREDEPLLALPKKAQSQSVAPRSRRSPAPVSLPRTEDTRAPLHVIDKLRMTISYAYRKARMSDPNLAGKLAVTCRMDEAGNLTPSEIIALTPELAPVADDVRDKVRRRHFPNTVTGMEEGTYQQIYFLTPSGF